MRDVGSGLANGTDDIEVIFSGSGVGSGELWDIGGGSGEGGVELGELRGHGVGIAGVLDYAFGNGSDRRRIRET